MTSHIILFLEVTIMISKSWKKWIKKNRETTNENNAVFCEKEKWKDYILRGKKEKEKTEIIQRGELSHFILKENKPVKKNLIGCTKSILIILF